MLAQMHRNPEFVEAPKTADSVMAGMVVTVRPLDDDDPEDEVYLLADSAEERAQGMRTITTTSPLGSALVGSKVGDEVAYEAPGGKFRYRVVEFRPLGA